MSTATLTLTELKQLIIDSLNLDGMRADDIGDDAPLFGAGLGLDSVDALELVVALEKRLGVRIKSHEVDPTAFASPASLLRYVESRRAPADGSAG